MSKKEEGTRGLIEEEDLNETRSGYCQIEFEYRQSSDLSFWLRFIIPKVKNKTA